MPISIGASENSFANPIGLLSDCHRRIERFLQALLTVATRVACGSLDAEHRRVLETALKYFRESARKHTADEEEDLFPKLRQLASLRISTVLADVDRLEAEHKTAEEWHREVEDLCKLWLGQDFLPPEDAAHLRRLLTSLSELYRTHIRMEEEQVFPAAQAELSASELRAIGCRMASRRGVLFIPERAVMSQLER
ncbi:MAG: hemerythrin domain-containing protein [Bryobacteraceae bacterium]